MKKLMFAASAALIAAVGLGVESGNVVGYVQKANTTGIFNARCAMFIPAGGSTSTGNTLANFYLAQADGDPIEFDSSTLWLMNANGKCVTGFYYADAEEADLEGIEVGWYTRASVDASEGDSAEWVKADSTSLAYGAGFVLDAQQSGLQLMFAGQVVAGSFDTILTYGSFNAVGNATAASVSIQDMALVQADGDPIEFDSSTLWLMNANGKCVTGFYYADAEEADLEGIEVGWYTRASVDASEGDSAEWVKATQVFNTGDGFVVDAQQSGLKLRLPSAL